jgi:hypothetical protein
MASANVEPIIDTSNSMTYSGYVEVTKTDSEAFIRSARPGDRIGVASYDQYGHIPYPPGGSALVEVDFTLQQTRQAAEAIQLLSFTGPYTNIGDGIVRARSLMDPAPAPKGLVLLSDGYQNYGTDPLTVLPSYPIYACAMGPSSDRVLMQQIASRTGGTYWYAPSVLDMTLIFNQIRGEQPQTAVVTNDQQKVEAPSEFTIPISGGSDGVQFMAVWNDTPEPPVVLLIQPDGTEWPSPPAVEGKDYTIWNLYEPAAHGDWRIRVTPAPMSVPTVTVSGYEMGADVEAVQLEVSHSGAGHGAADIHVQLLQDGVPSDGVQTTAEVIRPAHGLREIIDRLRHEAARVEVSHGEAPTDTPPDVVALRELARQSGVDTTRSTRHAVTLANAKGRVSGEGEAWVTLRIVSRCSLPSGETVQRTEVVTIPVAPSE